MDKTGKHKSSLSAEAVPSHEAGYRQVQRELAGLRDRAKALKQHPELICWLERDKAAARTVLRAIPRELDKRLHRDFWSRGIPVILTSGTLSAANSFARIKRSLGLDYLSGGKVMETRQPSPFALQENTLIYISESVPFPDNRDSRYLTAVAVESERLIRASHGHAAVLFTSYKAMDLVWERLSGSGLPFPFFRLDRGGVGAIDGFRRSGGGVLFASGSMWEGIDIPGDALSLLIIVRLPFPVPDPVSEYERTRYPNLAAYIGQVVVAEAQIRLKQGAGRLIRCETDTGVIALLDCRVRAGAPHRARMLAALPDCRVTSSIVDVAAFLREKKPEEYLKSLEDLRDGIYGKCKPARDGTRHRLPGGSDRKNPVPGHQRVRRQGRPQNRTGGSDGAPSGAGVRLCSRRKLKKGAAKPGGIW